MTQCKLGSTLYTSLRGRCPESVVSKQHNPSISYRGIQHVRTYHSSTYRQTTRPGTGNQRRGHRPDYGHLHHPEQAHLVGDRRSRTGRRHSRTVRAERSVQRDPHHPRNRAGARRQGTGGQVHPGTESSRAEGSETAHRRKPAQQRDRDRQGGHHPHRLRRSYPGVRRGRQGQLRAEQHFRRQQAASPGLRLRTRRRQGEQRQGLPDQPQSAGRGRSCRTQGQARCREEGTRRKSSGCQARS
ncbi:hypothetical protein Paride_0306 [Pseudomonas phage Paride]|nr:hypothetical protein Paride_0306 [Pseudomonas phage Paride]